MSFTRTALNLIALPLRRYRRHTPRPSPHDPRILVIRRNRLGDMIYTLPLLHALRRHFPQAHLTVACDPTGAPIAQACAAVNDVIILDPGRNRWQAVIKNAARLQDYDWVIAAKGGFDRRLASLARLTNGAIRVGFERRMDRPSAYYTDPVALPQNPHEEHQIETLLRLLRPLGLAKMNDFTIELSLRLPESSLQFAEKLVAKPEFHRFMLLNLSSTVRLKFRDEDFIALASRILAESDLTVGFAAAPADQAKAQALASQMASERVVAVATPGPLDLAALLPHAAFLVTPEGGAAHLAACVRAPALVLWSEGPFQKWASRGVGHVYVRAEDNEPLIPLEQVWTALQPLLKPKK